MALFSHSSSEYPDNVIPPLPEQKKSWMARSKLWFLAAFIGMYALVVLGLGIYWSNEPDTLDVQELAKTKAAELNVQPSVAGLTTTTTLINVADTLLNKPGGYLSNDRMPPGIYLDNMPNWEFGVLVQVRDMTLAFRNDFSRSQSQSTEDKDLIIAQPQFNFDSNSWILPSSESQYRVGVRALDSYLIRLTDSNPLDGQFYVRADNLRDWLSLVEKRLGSLSQRLSASVGQEGVSLTPAQAANATSDMSPADHYVKTPWYQVDDVFYEARGQAWALLAFFNAIEQDFGSVLDNKNARVNVQQIIRELESTQRTIWSPVILNGNGFGFVTNHSLIMASYLSRVNAAVIDLRRLLEQG